MPCCRATIHKSLAVALDNDSRDFILESVHIYRGNDKVQVVSSLDNLSQNDLLALSPSLPQGASAVAPYGKTSDVATTLIQKVYLAEALVHDPATEYAQVTCVVSSGYYNGETIPIYYRADFNSGIFIAPCGSVGFRND